MSQPPKRVYYSRLKIPNILQTVPGQQTIPFHLAITLPVRPVRPIRLTTVSVCSTAVQAYPTTMPIRLTATQARPTTAQVFYSTTMPTCQTEELTKQRYPNIRFEKDNNVLQTFNDKFENENDKLMIENKRSVSLNETNAEEARTEVTSQNKFLYETDWTNETNEVSHNFDAEIDINDSGNDYLIDFLIDEIRPEDFNEEVNPRLHL
ncbi:15489_t:CDS:2, partial [Funneliformis mosseae]